MPAAQADPGRPEARQLDVDAVAIASRRSAAGSTIVERHAEPARAPPDDRERLAGRAGHRQVAALDDRRLLAGDVADRRAEPVHVVEIDVRDRRHAAVPGVRRVEPPAEADLDEGEVDPLLGEPAEDDRGQELELGRRAEPPRRPDRRPRQDLVDEPRERRRVDGPPSIWSRSR